MCLSVNGILNVMLHSLQTSNCGNLKHGLNINQIGYRVTIKSWFFFSLFLIWGTFTSTIKSLKFIRGIELPVPFC